MINNQLFADSYANGFSATVRFLIGRGAGAEEAEEVAQAAWVRGWEARSQLQSDSRVQQWVNSIAFRKFCSEKRRLHRQAELSETADTRSGPAASAAKADLRVLMAKCSKLDRSLLLCRSFGYSTQQIAKQHGLTEVATRVRIHRSRKALRECIQSPRLTKVEPQALKVA
jgi:RNA polymerase sigma factor (sigma-70 family)